MNDAAALGRPVGRLRPTAFLDLDVFEGPFDLLVTLILNEDVDLLEVHLAEIVLAYVERLEARGELDLEAATEFLILIAALLELKSRLMLPSEEEEGLDLDPQEAAEELLARLLEYRKFRAGVGVDARALRRRAAVPLPRRTAAARAAPGHVRGGRQGLRAGAAGRRRCAALLRTPPPVDTEPHDADHRVAGAPPRASCGTCCAPGHRSRSRTRSAMSDRMTQAVTLFALLELYKSGELVWRQRENFGPIEIMSPAESMNPIARQVAALLFCSPEPVSRADLCEAIGCAEPRLDDAVEELRAQFAPGGDRASCCARSQAG